MHFEPNRLAALLFVVAVAAAYAHGTVETSSPKDGATLTAPPAEIRMKFTETLEPAFTSVKLIGPSGQEVAPKEKVRVEDGKTVVLPLPTLSPGAYKAQWMSAGHDGHHIHGELTFTVK